MINEFSTEVINEIKFYVYRLIDPRNGNTFYIGKGKGNRVFDHMKGALAFEGDENEASEKIGTIREIQRSGLTVIHVIHRHGLEDDTAFEVEAALIDAFPGLSNEAGGRGSRERGAMNALQIQNIYKAEEIIEIPEKCIIIKIKQWSVERHNVNFVDAIYEATRSAWKMSMARAKKAEYVLSVMDGVVRAVYSDMQWNFHREEKDRLEFDGRIAPDNITSKYIGRKIPPEYRKQGMASPCLYVNC
jgi:hypothetical protein